MQLLSKAVEGGLAEIAKYVLSRTSFYVNRSFSEGRLLLGIAASRGRLEVCKLLINKGADLNAQDDEG